MECSKCGATTTRDESFDTGAGALCGNCFLRLAQVPTALTGEQREALKRAVKEEMAGVIPRPVLEEIVEDGYARLLKGGDFDEEVHRLVNEIERLVGMAMFKEILSTVQELRKALEGQEEEFREKLKRLSSLQ